MNIGVVLMYFLVILNRAVTPYVNSVVYSLLPKLPLVSSFRFTDDIMYCSPFKYEKMMLSFPDLTCQCNNMFLKEEYSVLPALCCVFQNVSCCCLL